MRKGHDFSQGWGCGGICQTLANGVKIHVSSYPVLFQPLSLRKAAGGWGSYCLWEWGGKTVSPHPHAHSTHYRLHYGKEKPPPSLTEDTTLSTSALNTHALQFRVLPVVFHLHALPIVCSFFSRTGIFLAFGLMQWAESRALSSTNCCEGPFTFSAISQTGMVM